MCLQADSTPPLYSYVKFQLTMFWATVIGFVLCAARFFYMAKYADQRAARAARADRIRKLEEEDRKLKEKAREEEEAVRAKEAVRARPCNSSNLHAVAAIGCVTTVSYHRLKRLKRRSAGRRRKRRTRRSARWLHSTATRLILTKMMALPARARVRQAQQRHYQGLLALVSKWMAPTRTRTRTMNQKHDN